jgi:addiction module RelB/DinJ family antitoxin
MKASRVMNTNLPLNDITLESQAAEILSAHGLSITDAFRLMLRQVVLLRDLPFEYEHTPNADTLALIERIENGEEKLHGFDTWEQAKAWLNA